MTSSGSRGPGLPGWSPQGGLGSSPRRESGPQSLLWTMRDLAPRNGGWGGLCQLQGLEAPGAGKSKSQSEPHRTPSWEEQLSLVG